MNYSFTPNSKMPVCPPAPKKKHFARNLTDEELNPIRRQLFPERKDDLRTNNEVNTGLFSD